MLSARVGRLALVSGIQRRAPWSSRAPLETSNNSEYWARVKHMKARPRARNPLRRPAARRRRRRLAKGQNRTMDRGTSFRGFRMKQLRMNQPRRSRGRTLLSGGFLRTGGKKETGRLCGEGRGKAGARYMRARESLLPWGVCTAGKAKYPEVCFLANEGLKFA